MLKLPLFRYLTFYIHKPKLPQNQHKNINPKITELNNTPNFCQPPSKTLQVNQVGKSTAGFSQRENPRDLQIPPNVPTHQRPPSLNTHHHSKKGLPLPLAFVRECQYLYIILFSSFAVSSIADLTSCSCDVSCCSSASLPL